jgi:hypothetical protein
MVLRLGGPAMSALPPIATGLMHHSKASRNANSDNMHRSKKRRYSITSPSRARNVSGIRPSALPAFGLRHH